MLVNINEELAKKYGTNEAIFIQYFLDRAIYKRGNDVIFTHSRAELSIIFPFLSTYQIKRIRIKLLNLRLIEPINTALGSKRNITSHRILIENLPTYSKEQEEYSNNNALVEYRICTETENNSWAACSHYAQQFNFKSKSLGDIAQVFKIEKKNLGDIAQAFSQVAYGCGEVDHNQLVYCAEQNMNLTVMKVYRYQRGYLLYKYNKLLYKKYIKNFSCDKILNSVDEQESVKRLTPKTFSPVNNNCTLEEDKMQAKILRKHPCSPEQYMNSRFVLAELNNLIVPDVRRFAYDFDANNLGPIIEQLKRGSSLDDCLYVVKNKFRQWYNSPVMKNHLQSKTLFAEKHFKNYLSETVTGADDGKNTNASRSNASRSSGNNSTASSRANATLRSWGEQIEAAEKLYGVNVFDDDSGGDFV